jgi:tRNA(Ile)-lysidine synthetase-like protein
VNDLTRLPTAVRRKLIARWIHETSPGCFLDYSSLDHLLDALDQGERYKTNVSSNLWIETDSNHLRILKKLSSPTRWGPVAFPENVSLFLPNGGSLVWQAESLLPDVFASITAGHVDPGKQAFLSEIAVSGAKLFVRNWQPGDRLHHLGAPGERKLKKVFIDKKIAENIRWELPIVVSETDEILWVPGLPPAEKVKLSEPSERVIRLTYSLPLT